MLLETIVHCVMDGGLVPERVSDGDCPEFWSFPDKLSRSEDANGKDGWNYPAVENGTGSTEPSA